MARYLQHLVGEMDMPLWRCRDRMVAQPTFYYWLCRGKAGEYGVMTDQLSLSEAHEALLAKILASIGLRLSAKQSIELVEQEGGDLSTLLVFGVDEALRVKLVADRVSLVYGWYEWHQFKLLCLPSLAEMLHDAKAKRVCWQHIKLL